MSMEQMSKRPKYFEPTTKEIIETYIGSTPAVDKLFRTLGYLSKFFVFHSERIYGPKSIQTIRLKNASSIMSDWRFLTRFLNDFKIWNTILKLIHQKEGDAFLRFIQIVQNSILAFYNLVEHYYWGARKGIFLLSKEKQSIYARFCSACWTFNIILDFVSHFYIYKRNKRQRRETKDHLGKLDEELSELKVKVMISICDFPLALNGAMKNDPIHPLLLSIFGIIGSALGAWQNWKRCKKTLQK